MNPSMKFAENMTSLRDSIAEHLHEWVYIAYSNAPDTSDDGFITVNTQSGETHTFRIKFIDLVIAPKDLGANLARKIAEFRFQSALEEELTAK